MVSHLNSAALADAISNATYIVCRSGYSTMMDIASLQKNALCVPTPSQTEQEYLAKYLSENGFMVKQRQSSIDFDSAFIRLNHLTKFAPFSDEALVSNIKRVCNLLRDEIIE